MVIVIVVAVVIVIVVAVVIVIVVAMVIMVVVAVVIVVVVTVIVMAFVTFALEHVHGDIVWQSEAVVASGFDVEHDHAVLDVGLVAVVIV